MITPSGENNVTVTWETPENENGVLLYYQVKIFNRLRNYSKIVNLTIDEAKSVNFDKLGKIFNLT